MFCTPNTRTAAADDPSHDAATAAAEEVAGFDNRLISIDTRLAAVEAKIDGIETKFDARFDALEKRLSMPSTHAAATEFFLRVRHREAS